MAATVTRGRPAAAARAGRVGNVARLEAAPPEVMRESGKRRCEASGGAASCRAGRRNGAAGGRTANSSLVTCHSSLAPAGRGWKPHLRKLRKSFSTNAAQFPKPRPPCRSAGGLARFPLHVPARIAGAPQTRHSSLVTCHCGRRPPRPHRKLVACHLSLVTRARRARAR